MAELMRPLWASRLWPPPDVSMSCLYMLCLLWVCFVCWREYPRNYWCPWPRCPDSLQPALWPRQSLSLFYSISPRMRPFTFKFVVNWIYFQKRLKAFDFPNKACTYLWYTTRRFDSPVYCVMMITVQLINPFIATHAMHPFSRTCSTQLKI